MRSFRPLLASLLLSNVLLCSAQAAQPATPAQYNDPLVQDIERYLLLYSATGDERFLERLNSLGVVLEQKLATQDKAASLKDIWQLYQQTLVKVRDAYGKKGVDLKQAVKQTREVGDLFNTFLIAGSDPQPKLLAELRELALLEARKANGKLLGVATEKDTKRIGELQESVQQQLQALPANSDRDGLLMRWSYLRKTETDKGTLLYPFNAQIEYLTTHLPQS
ncbi:hypothetical protein JVX91_01540 [Pseudomonas sp. PDNC002]|uniref:hypothetical protein n=1 Tax=Pseudomonas sp. PDNC002 TaxID=2811422 RepID=UPI00196258DC|nr:hypothetical protein [Pseudomonas sp. PDNC002]QRY79826.1 hypothetical protein JVX91_01540 [Pseudomonas sp. PDNC002]